jgi:hypothetical protein
MVCSNSGELQKKNASVTLQGRSNHTLGQNETLQIKQLEIEKGESNRRKKF